MQSLTSDTHPWGTSPNFAEAADARPPVDAGAVPACCWNVCPAWNVGLKQPRQASPRARALSPSPDAAVVEAARGA